MKLTYKLFFITGLLALPLALITVMYVRQIQQIHTNRLQEQIEVVPVLMQIENLTRLMQDYSAGIPLWIIGSDIPATRNLMNSQAIKAGLSQIILEIKKMERVDHASWEDLAEKIVSTYNPEDSAPRSFEDYTMLTLDLINRAKILAYKYQLYAGTDRQIIVNRMTLDLAPSLSDSINHLRGLTTYKIFINEKSSSDIAEVSGYLSLITFRSKEIRQTLSIIEVTDPAFRRDIQPIVSEFESSLKIFTDLTESYLNEKDSRTESIPYFEASSNLMASIHKLTESSQKHIQRELQNEYGTQIRTLQLIVIFACLFAGLVLYSIFLISRSFVSDVIQIENVTTRIATGDRNISFPIKVTSSEIKSILERIYETYLAICDYEKRTRTDTWLLKSQKALNDQIRSETTLDGFAGKCLLAMSESIKADVCSFYRVTAEGFELCASHGVHSPRVFQHGEGLMGVAAIDGKLRHYTAEVIPENYCSIESTLGSARPRNLLIFPLRLQDEVIAVMEFLSLHSYDESVLRYLEAIEENTAILFRSVQSNIQVAELLKTTRIQSQELRSSNLILEEKTQQLNDQQNTLQQVNEELEEQRGELEIQNDNLASAMRDLAKAKKESELANQHKSIFLANISHELRTPLNSIMILSQVLAENRESNLQANQIKNARTIFSAGKDLLNLINEILDLSKIEADRIEITPSLVKIQDLSTDIRNLYSPIAERKNLEFKVVVSDDCPGLIETDAGRITQIIRNLAGNALKFTEKGHIQIEFLKSTEPGFTLGIIVKDTGIGIPQDKLQVIFEPFKQLNNDLTRKHEGTGLGLSISAKLAARLGGLIKVSSVLGEGSTFLLLVPDRLPHPSSLALPSPAAAPAPHDDRDDIKPRDSVILIIEDDPKFSALLQQRCHDEHFRTVVSSEGGACPALAERYHPLGIILDIKLPDGDGLEVLSRLKSNPRTRHIPVHVISFSDREKEALGRGAMSFAQKPVPIDKLDEIIRGLQNASDSESESVILLAKDEKDQTAIGRIFEFGKFRLEIAASSAQVMSRLGDKSYRCLIFCLMDLAAEKFQLLEELQEAGTFPNLPIVIYSGTRPSASEQGRLDYFSRQLSIREVFSIERLLDDVTLFIHSVDSANRGRTAVHRKDPVIPENVFVGKKILIVDDDIRNIYALRQILYGRGCDILVATNGLEALQALADHPDLSIILMDIMMPEMDGYEATRRIRSKPEHEKLPIIALTAKAMKEDRNLCLEAGASDYLTKPIDTDRIISLMRVWLSR